MATKKQDFESVVALRSQGFWTWVGQSKPTDWMIAIATIIGLTTAYRSGVFDAHKADISARNERLTMEKMMLEQRKETLTTEVENSRRELEAIRGKLNPLERERAAIDRIVAIRNGKPIILPGKAGHLSVGFKYNYELDGYELSAATYTVESIASNGASYSYDNVFAHPMLTDLLKAASELDKVTRLQIGKLHVSDEDIEIINKMKHVKYLEFKGTFLPERTLSGLVLGPKLKYLTITDAGLTRMPKLDGPNKLIHLFLAGNPIDDQCVNDLTQTYPDLKFLDLSRTQITAEGLTYINNIKKLASLKLYGNSLSDVSMLAFLKHPTFTTVEIEEAKFPTLFAEQMKHTDLSKNRVLFEDFSNKTGPPPIPDWF